MVSTCENSLIKPSEVQLHDFYLGAGGNMLSKNVTGSESKYKFEYEKTVTTTWVDMKSQTWVNIRCSPAKNEIISLFTEEV